MLAPELNYFILSNSLYNERRLFCVNIEHLRTLYRVILCYGKLLKRHRLCHKPIKTVE